MKAYMLPLAWAATIALLCLATDHGLDALTERLADARAHARYAARLASLPRCATFDRPEACRP